MLFLSPSNRYNTGECASWGTVGIVYLDSRGGSTRLCCDIFASGGFRNDALESLRAWTVKAQKPEGMNY